MSIERTTNLLGMTGHDWVANRVWRRRMIERDGAVCHICGEPIDLALDLYDRMAITVDHIMPTSLGGSDDMSNKAPAHRACNSSKHNKRPIRPDSMPLYAWVELTEGAASVAS